MNDRSCSITNTLRSFLVSTAALVERKTKGLTEANYKVNVFTRKTITYYVALMATIPPAAPAMEWITESLAMVVHVLLAVPDDKMF